MRNRLPNRRPAETIAFVRDGSQYQMTVGLRLPQLAAAVAKALAKAKELGLLDDEGTSE